MTYQLKQFEGLMFFLHMIPLSEHYIMLVPICPMTDLKIYLFGSLLTQIIDENFLITLV